MENSEIKCADLKTLEWNFPEQGRKIDLVLKPMPAKNGVPQYWQLNEAGNLDPSEAFGNMDFKIKSGQGALTLNVTLDSSEFGVDDLQFMDFESCKQLDGIIPLSPDFRHQFRTRVKNNSGGKELKIKIWDVEEVADDFSFLWFCYSPSLNVHFVSGDPNALIDPL
ncbi:hypothetical protein [Microbulbifer zhoushanensis]|uniref:hypothetical protein n=1 Tax=Microbulbifer zhoushanensis TaxID=2904254 RepID=UPI001F42A9A9|nr:hypothetical protein [Microbulbifer zhoushanensis]